MVVPGPRDGLLIVIGVHGTPSSDAAIDWAAREARLRRAAVHLVLARDPGSCHRAPYARPSEHHDRLPPQMPQPGGKPPPGIITITETITTPHHQLPHGRASV